MSSGADCAPYTGGLLTFAVVFGVFLIIASLFFCCAGCFYHDSVHDAYLEQQGSEFDVERAKMANEKKKKNTIYRVAMRLLMKGIVVLVLAEAGGELLSLLKC